MRINNIYGLNYLSFKASESNKETKPTTVDVDKTGDTELPGYEQVAASVPITTYDTLKEIPDMEPMLYYVHPLSKSRVYKPNVYRGEALCNAPSDAIEILKEAGIEKVVDLYGYGDDYKEALENNGFKYYCYPMHDFMSSHNRYSSEEQKDMLVDFIKTMQGDNIYMGCNTALGTTDEAAMLNDIFNPKFRGGSWLSSVASERCESIWEYAQEMYELMTEDDKKSMGWTPEFEQKFCEKVARLLTK